MTVCGRSVLALLTLGSLVLAFACAYRQAPRKLWPRVHLSAMLFSYYLLVASLIHELFARLPALEAHRVPLAHTQGTALLAFLMVLAYFWGKTAPHPPTSNIYVQRPTTQT